jgi:hypothetical protein
MFCSAGCTDVTQDSNNCGGCGNTCPASHPMCEGSACCNLAPGACNGDSDCCSPGQVYGGELCQGGSCCNWTGHFCGGTYPPCCSGLSCQIVSSYSPTDPLCCAAAGTPCLCGLQCCSGLCGTYQGGSCGSTMGTCQ